MKTIIISLLIVLPLLTNQVQQTSQLPKGSEEELNLTKEAVISWADKTFKEYDNPRFENFVAHYTDEYLMMKMRVGMLEKRKTKIDTTQTEEIEKIDNQIERVKQSLRDMDEKVTHYGIDFWANILTNDGITVQYRHSIKLDNDYKVVSFEETSAIGKKSSSTRIRYKKSK